MHHVLLSIAHAFIPAILTFSIRCLSRVASMNDESVQNHFQSRQKVAIIDPCRSIRNMLVFPPPNTLNATVASSRKLDGTWFLFAGREVNLMAS
jgi:hypothetical protein